MGVWKSAQMKADHPMKRPEVAAKVSKAHRESGRFSGANHPNWKGGEWQRSSDGRWMVRVPGGVKLRYRLVWDEAHPDDPLRPGELIHHINHDPTDDRPENLMKLPGHGHHAKEHDFGHNPKARRGNPKRAA